jgi:hypothetical protein
MPPDSVLEAVQASSPVKLGEGGCGKDVQLGERRAVPGRRGVGEEAGFWFGVFPPSPLLFPPFFVFFCESGLSLCFVRFVLLVLFLFCFVFLFCFCQKREFIKDTRPKFCFVFCFVLFSFCFVFCSLCFCFVFVLFCETLLT